MSDLLKRALNNPESILIFIEALFLREIDDKLALARESCTQKWALYGNL